jgi:uncharacterized membrane protein
MKKKVSKPTHHIESELTCEDQLGMERLIFFSDAVFAIAITLLVLEVRLPGGEKVVADTELFILLTGIWHKYLAYFISFMVIGTFWMAHHRKFKFIKRYDSHLIFLNLLLLMTVAFIPFPSSVLSEYSERTATIFYALIMAFSGSLLTIMWWYASSNNRLTDHTLDMAQRKRQFLAPLSITAIFLLSIGIAFLNADAAKFSWILILPASLYANKK